MPINFPLRVLRDLRASRSRSRSTVLGRLRAPTVIKYPVSTPILHILKTSFLVKKHLTDVCTLYNIHAINIVLRIGKNTFTFYLYHVLHRQEAVQAGEMCQKGLWQMPLLPQVSISFVLKTCRKYTFTRGEG